MAILIEDERDLYWLLMSEFRYAIKRDNHLAPGSCCDLVKKYLPKMETYFQQQLAVQLMEEIISERIWYLPINKTEYYIYKYPRTTNQTEKIEQLEYDYEWENLMIFLLDYIDHLPYNYKEYLKYIYGHIVYSDGIGFDSQIIRDKVHSNCVMFRNRRFN